MIFRTLGTKPFRSRLIFYTFLLKQFCVFLFNFYCLFMEHAELKFGKSFLRRNNEKTTAENFVSYS